MYGQAVPLVTPRFMACRIPGHKANTTVKVGVASSLHLQTGSEVSLLPIKRYDRFDVATTLSAAFLRPGLRYITLIPGESV